jgi:hypothetical protein
MSKVIRVKLVKPSYKRDIAIENMFFNLYGVFNNDEIYGFVVDEAILSPEVANIIENVLPREGKFTIELGAELNELYPNLNGHSDYAINIKDIKGTEQKVYVSNQMAKVFVKKDSADLYVLFNQIYKDKVYKNKELKLNEDNFLENLKTFLAWQFTLEGESVKDIFERYLQKKIDEFIVLINEFVNSINLILQEKEEFPLIVPSYSIYTLPSFYFLVKGNDEKMGHGVIVTHPKGVTYVTDNLNDKDTELLKDMLICNQEINLWDVYYTNGKSLIMNGQLKSGILSLFTCCELILSKYLRDSLSNKGISKTKYDDNSRDITFSLMSNFLLYSVVPEELKPDDKLIGNINRLRKIRNDLIHKGIFELNYDSCYEFVNIVYDFRKYLLELMKKL